MSSLLSRFTHFSGLFIPPLVLFIGLAVLYSVKTSLLQTWLADIQWMSYVSLAIAAIIAWQFGRSRLVYACLLMVVVLVQPFVYLAHPYFDAQLSALALCLFSLLFSQDKGFSLANLIKSLLLFSAIVLVSWLALPSLANYAQPWLSSFTRLIFEWAPDLLASTSSFYLVLIFILSLMAILRVIISPTNTHNALLYALFMAVSLSFYADPYIKLIGILGLSVLICYSVLKDSFTMAFKDELTGIPSRRALMQYVPSLGRKYTVVMSDIDHFKKFNDTYGHDVGDEVLKLVASKLAKIQGGGKTFRFGGEEFIMVFAGKTAEQVAPFVEVVRQTIADYDIALRAKPRPAKPKNAKPQKPAKDKIVKVTSSFGLAQRSKQHASFADIMKQADIALYAAKKAGRNRVKIANQ
ncbi:diguanylate cyclase [Paraglaciecola aestuariivivens]